METKKILVLTAIGAIIVLAALIGVKQSDAPSASETATNTEETATTSSEVAEETVETTTTTPSPTPTSKKPAQTQTTSSATPTPVIQNGVYVVTYTRSGFSPNILEISTGKSVRFVNNSDKAMRIFSNDISNSVYTTLNSSKTVGKGGYYDFTFLHKGNWGYHNQNNSADTGLVIVK